MNSLFRHFILPLALGAAITLVAVCVYWVLEVLLADRTSYNRGLWEGAVTMLIMMDGNKFVHWVLRRVDAKKKKRLP